MRIGRFQFSFAGLRRKAQDLITRIPPQLGAWWPIIREPFAGAWQRGLQIDRSDVLGFSTVYACTTLIASDISKLGVDLIEQDEDGIWSPTTNPAYSPVLTKPNHYQTRIQFVEQWILSKLIAGNTYVLKERDGRGVVVALYILNPLRVTPLVAPDGEVFYQLQSDVLAGLGMSGITVPAREIIHDRMNCLYHPLCGLPPLYAGALAATQGLKIQQQSARFFAQGSQVGGVILIPTPVSNEVVERLRRDWEENYAGEKNVGRVAVLENGMQFKQTEIMSAVNAQLIEQLNWADKALCSVYHVPPFMVGVGEPPRGISVESMLTMYYSQALQNLIECFELSLDEGLGLSADLGIEVDVAALLRMDTPAAMKVATDGIGGGLLTVNEGRRRFDLAQVTGGDTVYLQQQYFSLEALNKRDAAQAAPGTPAPVPPNMPIPKPGPASEPAAPPLKHAEFAAALWKGIAAWTQEGDRAA